MMSNGKFSQLFQRVTARFRPQPTVTPEQYFQDVADVTNIFWAYHLLRVSEGAREFLIHQPMPDSFLEGIDSELRFVQTIGSQMGLALNASLLESWSEMMNRNSMPGSEVYYYPELQQSDFLAELVNRINYNSAFHSKISAARTVESIRTGSIIKSGIETGAKTVPYLHGLSYVYDYISARATSMAVSAIDVNYLMQAQADLGFDLVRIPPYGKIIMKGFKDPVEGILDPASSSGIARDAIKDMRIEEGEGKTYMCPARRRMSQECSGFLMGALHGIVPRLNIMQQDADMIWENVESRYPMLAHMGDMCAGYFPFYMHELFALRPELAEIGVEVGSELVAQITGEIHGHGPEQM